MSSKATMVNAFNLDDLERVDPYTRDLIERRDKVLGPGYRLFYDEPLLAVRGSGAYLYDAHGKEYLDAYNNVPSVGHCHPHVTEAVHRQMQTLNTNTRYVQEQIVNYAERLTSTFPATLDRVTFTCTGSEANDLALRVARHYTGNQGVIVTENAYHGLTSEVAAFSPSLGTGSALGPHVRTIKAPHPRNAGVQDMEKFVRAEVRQAVEDLHRHGYELAAFFADSIFSSDGVLPGDGFLKAALEEVHRAGGLYVADEVQPGFSRLGETWWGFQKHGIEPDLVTLGKPMGNGLPISGVVFKTEVMEEFDKTVRYFNTFGGSSVSIAAADAVLDVLINERLGEQAKEVGAIMSEGISQLVGSSSRSVTVRGAGLFIGVEVDDAQNEPDSATASLLVNDLRQRGVLISASGPFGNVLKVRPPLAFGLKEADRFLEVFDEAVRTIL